MFSYVWRDLVRNPRRTLASLAGVVLGVGLFSGVLFFIAGSGATMTRRAVAPLALDMQRVLTSPLGGGLRLVEHTSGSEVLGRGDRVKFILSVTNEGDEPAHEVVVNDEPSSPLAYVPGTTTLAGKTLHDKGGRSPLAHGLARSGMNIGTVPPRTTIELTYVARARRPVDPLAALELRGTVSSREEFVPLPANPPAQLTLEQLRTKVAAVPGVASADGLSFVDLPPGSLQAGPSRIGAPVRVFAFDRTYQQHYPSIRIASGSFAPGSALLSAEASRALGAKDGGSIGLDLPGRTTPLPLPIGGTVDLGRAKPLFYSRNSNQLEDFLYVPNSVVVPPTTFEHEILPAFRAARAKVGTIVKSLPVQEVDVLINRSLLKSAPAAAFDQTKAIAQSIDKVAPGQDYLIDNVSNALQVARDDAVVGRRMFLFLGLPGVLLAAVLAAYGGSVLASTQRREHALLRVRGAHRGHLRRLLVYRTLAFAGIGSLIGAGLGFVSALWVLSPSLMFEAGGGDLALSALIAMALGMLVTSLGLYFPVARSLNREVTGEYTEMAVVPVPLWRRWRLDLVMLGVAVIAEVIAYRGGAFDPPPGSVSTGEAVSLPARLLVAPVVAWFGGILLSGRIFEAVMAKLPVPSDRFGPAIRGTLIRSLRRRRAAVGAGIAGVGLVLAFGMSLGLFTATYNSAKAQDARYVVGSDLRITPSALEAVPRSADFANQLEVPGITAVTPVVSKPENAVLIGADNQDRAVLTAIDPESFTRVGALSDSAFVDHSVEDAMTALKRDPRTVLVEADTADGLGISPGRDVQVLLARGTKHQVLETFHVGGLFTSFPGSPQGTDLVANLHFYEMATGLSRVNFFLARTVDPGHAGLQRAVTALRSGPGKNHPIDIDTTETTLDKDQSSLTALNIQGLARLNSLYTLLMSVAVIAIFVFGLMLQRRREYVTLRAQGLQVSQLRALLLAEAGFVALCGLVAGALVGTGLAYLLVHILRGLFILEPTVALAPLRFVTLAGLTAGATLVSALAASMILRFLKPAELLRET